MIKKILKYLANIEYSVLFFFFFVFYLPFSKRMEILTNYSYLDDKFLVYLTYLIYGFELFLITSFVFWFYEILKNKEKKFYLEKNILVSYLLILFFSFISLFVSQSETISLYYIFMLIVLFLVVLFISNKINNKKNIFILLNVFSLSVFIQSLIAIFQFIKNQSLGLYLFGESLLSSSINGVAKTLIDNEKHIRSYGTLSHPNILGMFLFVAGLINIHLFFNYKNNLYKYCLVFSLFAVSLATFFTFSRITWILCLLFWGLYIYKISNFQFPISNKGKKWNRFYYLIPIFLIFMAVLVYFAPAIWWRVNPFIVSTWQSWGDRAIVFQKSFELIRANFWGIGIGNFMIAIAYRLTGYPLWLAEPAHNIFILILTEIGVLGFFSFTAFLTSCFLSLKKSPLFLKYIFYGLFIFMFFDHAFWDIRNAQYLFFIIIGLVFSYSFLNQQSS